jgi:hypothetical protein
MRPESSEPAIRHRGIPRLIPPASYGVRHSDKRIVMSNVLIPAIVPDSTSQNLARSLGLVKV